MKKATLLLMTTFLFGVASYAQNSTSIQQKINQKELELINAVTSTRQVNNSIREELKQLYTAYKVELENEINTTTDFSILAAKRDELELVNQKINNYSLQK